MEIFVKNVWLNYHQAAISIHLENSACFGSILEENSKTRGAFASPPAIRGFLSRTWLVQHKHPGPIRQLTC